MTHIFHKLPGGFKSSVFNRYLSSGRQVSDAF